MDYLDFELEIAAASASGYPVTVIRSPAGEAHASMHLPFDDQALSTQLATLHQVLTSAGEMDSQLLATQEQTIQTFGQSLFEALFTGQVRDLYVASRTAAESQGKGLRLKLRLEPAELAALPWEVLYDAGQQQYLCLSDTTPIVRYVELPRPCQPLLVTPPLSILGMTASPKDLPELDVAREQQRINTSLASLQARGLAQVNWLAGHTWQDLQQALLAGPWHIFHFIGHGGFDLRTNEGVMVLEDSTGAAHALSATQLGLLLADHHALRLVVLNACQGARGSTHDLFASTAATLVRRGIPAVLAMQDALSDAAALALSRTFYGALATGMPIDAAVSEARKAICLGGGQSLEWGTPVLHLHAPDGILFQLGQPPSINRGATAASTREAAPGAAAPTPARTPVIASAQAAPLAMQEPLAASLVRIRTPDGGVVGAGFFVGERQVLTCAHVVAGALGLADDPPEKPQTPVCLDIPRVAPRQLLTARVVLWRPPRADGGDDIAGLELDDDPPQGAQAAPLAQVEDLWEHSFRAFGFPRGQDTGVWATGRLLGRQLTNWVQIEDVKAPGFAVEPGFSGAPVWDTQVEAVVGMVVAAERRTDLKTAFAIPVDVLARIWPLLESRIHPFVFLCYARADSELVTRLRSDLLRQGVYAWIDREGLQPGTLDWEEALRTAIRAAQAVLLIASPSARSSRYVRDELRIAELYQRPVYPLWIAGTHWMDAVPLGWGGVQYLDARESRYETALPELVEILNKVPSTPPKPPELAFEPRNPYKGLRAFIGDDARDFFGRDALINELAATLEGTLTAEAKSEPCERLLAVVGASGSGKSSVLLAGLLPRLREGKLPGSEQWVYLDPIVPGARPIEALTLALSEHLPEKSLKAVREDLEDDSARGLHLLATRLAKRAGTKVVLLVDQFEELFTQTPSEDERRHFLDLLVTAATEPHGPVIVLLTLRADFYDRPMRYPLLYQLMQAHQTSVLPMGIHDLRDVIEKPAALSDVGLTFEGDLVGDLLFEVQGQVGALPLLQFTLDQLFQRRSGRQLTLSAYRELGGVKGALTRQAEKTYSELPSDEHRKLARALFVRLIDPGASEQDTTRRRAALSEFTLDDPTQTRLMQGTIDAFITARLLTTNEVAGTTTIEVSHEALIREWPRLAEWMREARQDIPLQQTLSEDVAEWERRGKPGDRLYRGSQLKEPQAWAKRNIPSRNEVAFLRAGAVQRMRSIASMTVIVLLLLSTAGIALQLFLLLPHNPTVVTTINDDGPGSLRQAIILAKPGDTITFDPSVRGTIKVTNDDLTIPKNLTIRGPGAGILTIRGGGGGHIFSVTQFYKVSISGITFRAIGIENHGTLAFTDSTIIGTRAGSSGGIDGGGINNEGTLSLTNTTVSALDQYGQGLFNDGALTLTNSTISGNMHLGGIRNDGKLTLINSTVSGNTAQDSGGGISNWGTLTLSNSTVSGNTAQDGGGIYNDYSGTLMLSNSTVSGNTATGGGGIFNDRGTLTVSNSTVSDNTATGGGGISNDGGTLTVSNSTISGNTTLGPNSEGGGIFIQSTLYGVASSITQTDLTFSTIYGNIAHGGGDIAIEDIDSDNNKPIKQLGQVRISNSIVAGDPAHPAPDIVGMLTSYGYNLFQDNSGATFDPATNKQHDTDKTLSVIELTKLFASTVELRNNGGRTKTLALASDSPAVDRIPLNACNITVPIKDSNGKLISQYTITTDQRGVKRPDGNEQFCDIGAYEYVDSG